MSPAAPFSANENDARFAVYFAPDPDGALWHWGSSVIGRDAARDSDIAPPLQLIEQFPDWKQRVAPAVHYGFHATLKPPFNLAAGVEPSWLTEEATALCATLHPVSIGRLKVATIGRFIALVPVSPPAALNPLAAEIVRALDALRAPLTEADRNRRNPKALTPRQIEHLDRWGYPYVFDEFRFHMTLTGPLDDTDRVIAQQALTELYAKHDQPVSVDQICIVAQPHREAPFKITNRIPLRG